jgi:hypothetical protein
MTIHTEFLLPEKESTGFNKNYIHDSLDAESQKCMVKAKDALHQFRLHRKCGKWGIVLIHAVSKPGVSFVL